MKIIHNDACRFGNNIASNAFLLIFAKRFW